MGPSGPELGLGARNVGDGFRSRVRPTGTSGLTGAAAAAAKLTLYRVVRRSSVVRECLKEVRRELDVPR